MKTTHHQIWIASTTLLILSLACATLAPESANTPLPTNTSLPAAINTPTQAPTSTPRPTKTPLPPTATAAPVGVTASNSDYDVDVIKVRKLGSVYLDQNYVWQANPGYLFLELGVKVTSKRTGTTSIPWENIYVIEQDNKSWFPNWGGYQTAGRDETLNTTSIIFAEIKNGKELISFNEAVYLRVIWTIKDNNPSIVYFGFDTSPLIEVVID